MRWFFGAAIVALAAHAVAATWACSERTAIMTTTLVMVRCQATGSYTTGGDQFINANVDLCNTVHRHPVGAVASTATSATTGMGYVVSVDRTTSRVVLLTSTNTPGPQDALIEVNAGTAIDGATFMALVNCSGF